VVATMGLAMGAMAANVLATGIATVPPTRSTALDLGSTGCSDPWREVLPFWVLSFCGLPCPR